MMFQSEICEKFGIFESERQFEPTPSQLSQNSEIDT